MTIHDIINPTDFSTMMKRDGTFENNNGLGDALCHNPRCWYFPDLNPKGPMPDLNPEHYIHSQHNAEP